MAAACGGAGVGTGPDDFEPWLSDKLRALRTDESVFGSYIAGILDGEDSLDDKKEALEAILSDFVERDIEMHVSEILDKWTICRTRLPAPTTAAPDVDLQLARLLEAQALATAAPRRYTDEEKKIRDVILSQYSQLSDHEEGLEGVGTQTEREQGPELERNTNAETVAAAARERRDQARLDSQRKKEKDKEDREKQKQQKEEKKEKRKTQKGERKR